MIIAGNFKANHTRASTAEYLSALDSLSDQKKEEDSIVIFPPFTALDNYNLKNIKIGAQNGYPAEKGSYTGEICLEALSEFDIDTILIGHSERRHILKEPQDFIVRKYEFFKRNNFNIFYCVGEPIEIRQKGIESVMNYIDKQLENIDVGYQNLVIAYEPVWAIGTGLTASVEDIEEVHKAIRERVETPILYGGSVNASNAADILNSSFVDGVLVGGASLVAEEFYKIIKASANIS
ncbi:MAG: triose-phosphate isomerase [Campylobacteraceae bacterium]|jgi:triosephosphate isomerase|nr:triose-phosphate isomerase [Campylobacteraceae bacterium]